MYGGGAGVLVCAWEESAYPKEDDEGWGAGYIIELDGALVEVLVGAGGCAVGARVLIPPCN